MCACVVQAEPGDIRTTILDQAQRLFVQHGYHGLSMRQIAEAVGVSKTALYYHFKDKEELFLAILLAYLDEMGQLLNRVTAAAPDASQRIHLLVEEMLSQPIQRRAAVHLASQEAVHLGAEARLRFNLAYRSHFLDRIRWILEDGMRRGELRAMDPEAATWGLLGLLYPYFFPSTTAQQPPPVGAVETLTSIFLHGLAAG